jgi:hypothetical protein
MYRGGDAELRRLVERGRGEERGDFSSPRSCGECRARLLSVDASFGVAEPAIFRFLVEAVVKPRAYLEPQPLAPRTGGRERGNA